MYTSGPMGSKVLLVLLFFFLLPLNLSAQPTVEPFTEDVRNTKHNFSANPIPNPALFRSLFDPDLERNIKALPKEAGGTTEVCIFCHTPHGADPQAVGIRAPIWNRQLSSAHYVLYDQVWSRSFEAALNPGAPTGFSRLCLSCHDGTIAIGQVVNKEGSGGLNAEPYRMEYPTGQAPAGPPGSIPVGSGLTTGDTRALGTDLRNDHPISMVFNSELLSKDLEFVDPGPPIRRPHTQSTPTPIAPARRATGLSTEIFDTVQCTSCHNPHQVDFPKFLRANRLQQPTDNHTQVGKESTQAILCLFCHDKPGWPYNAAPFNTHANAGPFPDETRLKPGATNLHTFDQPTVGERACLGCHDPHATQGALRLMREGADEFGDVAIENTCYQCHSPQIPDGRLPGDRGNILQPHSPTTAPDVRTQFLKDREGNSHRGFDGGTAMGSAMDLRLGLGHQPVFVDLPREGVQLGSDNRVPSFFGGPFPEPAGNKVAPEHAPHVPDSSHVECVDCHNMHRVTRGNRFGGMPGITIRSGIVATTLQKVDERREPFIFEVCLRCHGNTFNNHVREGLSIAVGTGKLVQGRGNNSQGTLAPQFGILANGSNKRKEFDPTSIPFYLDNFKIANPINPTGPLIPDPNPPMFNTSFHPVSQIGRNQSGVLNNFAEPGILKGQLMGGFGPDVDPRSPPNAAAGLRRDKTIHCTDCHNTDLFGTYRGGTPIRTFSGIFPTGFVFGGQPFFGVINFNFPDFPGPITFDDSRDDPWRRSTDVLPNIPRASPPMGAAATLNDPNTPQGPHGSIYKRILRANYDTTVGTKDDKPVGTIDSLEIGKAASYNPQNFALCYNCHSEAAFVTPYWGSPDDKSPPDRLTNFYRAGTASIEGGPPSANLHYIHLVTRTNARCHECHNNVHSNVEAGNTVFVGLNNPEFVQNNPGHNRSTHLINFSGPISGNRVPNMPMWGDGAIVNIPRPEAKEAGDPGHTGPGCNLRCHGFPMRHNYDAHSVEAGEKVMQRALVGPAKMVLPR